MLFQVVFNLYPFSEHLYLPSANIVQHDKGGQLAHLVQKATAATVVSYGLELSPLENRLIGLIEQLTPKSLEAKYKPPKAKTAPTLDSLLAEKATKEVVERFIFNTLDVFLDEIVRNRLPLTIDAERKTLVKDVQVVFPREELIPYLFFKKTTEGIEYRLQLGTETQRWSLREHNIVPLTNLEPAWILVDYALFRVPGINGNMVKPFRQKDTVLVPARSEREYFRKVIAKSIRRGMVEAEGFRVEKTETLRTTRLETVENILENRWLLKPVFEYDGAEFHWGERRDRITSLDIPEQEQGEIAVHLICRDTEQETQRIDFLRHSGLLEEGRTLFPPNEETGKYAGLQALLNWLSSHRAALEGAGFRILAPQADGRTLALAAHDITVRSEAADDWFDVQGRVVVGAFNFPFQRLLPNLRRADPFFELPDGTFFLIPEEWFARFADLAGVLQEQGEMLRLPKSLYTVLQESEPESSVDKFPVIDPELIDYQPSESLKATLRPYQLQGVKWLVGHYLHGFGACLADDMGLGKTLQTIAIMLYAKEVKDRPATAVNGADPAPGQLDLFAGYRAELRPLNALLILPASLIFNWQKELARFAPSLFSYAHIGPKRLRDARALGSHDIVLTTYHTARQDLDLLEKVKWHFIVLDESQQIKNRDSEISKVVRSLNADCKISLSGTPIENSLADLWTQMEFINPATLGSYRQFREQFQTPIEKQQDERAKARLFSRVQPFFLRRTKEEVAPDLPELTTQIFYSEMSPEQKKYYEQVKSVMRNQILSLFDDPKTRLQALQALSKLRQIANHPKLADADYKGSSAKMEDVLAQWDVVRRSGHKALFFSSYEKHLQLYRATWETEKQPYAWLTGDTAQTDRGKEVERFQSDQTVQAFLMTLGAGGVGLNLTAADYVFLLDPWWNPAKEDQAIARAHRIGRLHPVTALRFISRGTIEEKILLLQERKRALGKDLFASADAAFPHLDREDLEMLLQD
ncbi:MAG: DEAD/DEAH box helicase [Saprospiraceae bacterium]|nr:DEAD/DEAH box helicase [Saprospiraceae bacterium]